MALRILIVDTQRHSREGLAGLLSATGHAVSVVSSASAGLESMATGSFDVVILDADDSRGKTALSRIVSFLLAARSLGEEAHRVLVSSFAEELPRDLATHGIADLAAHGVLAVLEKPVELHRLWRALEVAESSRARRAEPGRTEPPPRAQLGRADVPALVRLDLYHEGGAAMPAAGWNSWKVTAIGMSLGLLAAMMGGFVLAERSGPEPDPNVPAAVSAPPTPAPARRAEVPRPADVEACNTYARSAVRVGAPGAVRGVAIGGALGAGAGAAGRTAAWAPPERKSEALDELAGSASTPGFDDASRRDAGAMEAYRSCMRGRGYPG